MYFRRQGRKRPDDILKRRNRVGGDLGNRGLCDIVAESGVSRFLEFGVCFLEDGEVKLRRNFANVFLGLEMICAIIIS
jgi:hypothetical protein